MEDIKETNKPDVSIFVESRISGSQARKVIQSLRFMNLHRIEAIRFARGNSLL